jgi:DNA-binding CsgD family transcriptional regulator
VPVHRLFTPAFTRNERRDSHDMGAAETRSVLRRRDGDDHIIIAQAPDAVRVRRSSRAHVPDRAAPVDGVTQITGRELACGGLSLRKIARRDGVSHETVRKVLRDVDILESRARRELVAD